MASNKPLYKNKKDKILSINKEGEACRLKNALKSSADEDIADIVGEAETVLREKIREGNLTAVLFVLKTRGRWANKTDAPQNPKDDPALLSDDELMEIIENDEEK